MDLDFREPTDKEREYIINKTLQCVCDVVPYNDSSDGLEGAKIKSTIITDTVIVIFAVGLILFGFVTSMKLDNAISKDFLLAMAPYFVLLATVIISIIVNKSRLQRDSKKEKMQKVSESRKAGHMALTLSEANNRINNATLKVADVSFVRREKIMTDKEDAYYVEVMEADSVIGKTLEFHTFKEIYDAFEEGKKAYVVWWDFQGGSIGADVCEIMLRRDE